MMKLLMLKQKLQTFSRFKLFAFSAIVLIISSPIVHAVTSQDLQSQIDALNKENASNAVTLNSLSLQADSYQDAINKLDAQINTLQQQIVANQNKQAEIQNQITQAQADLDQQKKVLGENIKAMYLDGDISALEVLAASKNISEYVDKQQNRNAVQLKVANTLTKINELKQELMTQKNAIESLLSQQTVIRSKLAADESQQSQMLAYTQGQKDAFNSKIKQNSDQIAKLRAQQIALNIPKGSGALTYDPSNGYYPYANYGFSMSTAPGCGNPDPVTGQTDSQDKWGYCTRQCVSYAAWAVERSGRSAPYYYGNAASWVGAAYRDGVSVYTSDPQPGDVAISTAGYWGHAMYVEAVDGSQITVSQYNVMLDGKYTLQNRSWSGLYFLRFP